MENSVKVRWLGEAGGPDEIEQFGITFPRKEWVDVPASDSKEDQKRLAKLRGNRFFEVEGNTAA